MTIKPSLLSETDKVAVEDGLDLVRLSKTNDKSFVQQRSGSGQPHLTWSQVKRAIYTIYILQYMMLQTACDVP